MLNGYRTWPLRLAGLMAAALVAVPVVWVFSDWWTAEPEIWSHLRSYVLPEVLRNTVALVTGVAVGATVLGVSLAWLTATCRFPGSRWFRWVLMLPLAMPAYVLAFAQVGLFDFTGPFQTAWRGWFGSGAAWPAVRSTGGAIAVLTLATYPYVFLLARSAFDRQGRRSIEVAQTLGLGPVAAFFRVSVPLARPWILSGLLLALMETLADFGAVYILGVDTFTTAIYKAWFALFSLPAANQLASLLVTLALVLMLAERVQRRRRRFTDRHAGLDPVEFRLRGVRALAATAFCAGVLGLAFVLPVAQLTAWALPAIADEWSTRYLGDLARSLALASLAMLLVVSLGLAVAYGERRFADRWAHGTSVIASAGYAIPGVVLAVGLYQPLQRLDAWLTPGTGWLTGTLVVMLLALAARFMAVSLAPIGSGLERISPSLEQSARTLGASGAGLVRRLHVPLLGGSLATAGLLVFVDVMKEMPITLMTRPFGWDTLSVRLFELTSEGEWRRAALPALTLVAAGLLPVTWLGRMEARKWLV